MGGLDLNKKLWRVPQHGMVKGVCAGIAQYLDVPVKLVRLITVLAMIFGLFFFVVVAYIILTFALDPMPESELYGEKCRPAVSCWPRRIKNWRPANAACAKWNAMSRRIPLRYAAVFASSN
jgi:phage shock protein C